MTNYIQKTFVSKGPYPNIILCLLSVIRFYKGFIDPAYLALISKINDGKTNLSNLSKAAEIAGLKSKGEKSTLEQLRKVTKPAILGVTNDNGKHDCIVYYGYIDQHYIVGIPFFGILQYTEVEMQAIWESQIIIKLEPADNFVLDDELQKKKRTWFRTKFRTTLISFILISIIYIVSFTLISVTVYFFYKDRSIGGIAGLLTSSILICMSYVCKQFVVKSFKTELFCLAENKNIQNNLQTKLSELTQLICFTRNTIFLVGLSVILIVSQLWNALLMLGIAGILIFAGIIFSGKIYKLYIYEGKSQEETPPFFSIEAIELNYVGKIFKVVFPVLAISILFISAHQPFVILFLWITWFYVICINLLLIPKIRYFFFTMQKLYYFYTK